MPLSVALGTLAIFLFFVHMGPRSRAAAASRRQPPPAKIDTGQPTLYTYAVVKEYDHDPGAFTQGLQYDERCDGKGRCADVLWESTGLRGRSTVREVDLATGQVLRSRALPREDFGEGLTRLGGRLHQVVWQSGKAWSYDVDDFDDVQQRQTPLRDGWGITTNGTHLIVGDSSDTLYFLDPETLKVERKVQVTDNGVGINWLNELEWVDGLVYANVYQTDCLAQIDPGTGAVVGWVVLAGLKQHMLQAADAAAATAAAAAAGDNQERQREQPSPDVLNGVAWDSKRARLFVTGKLWPKLYQVELRPMYQDSKTTDVAALTAEVRAACIVRGDASLLGR